MAYWPDDFEFPTCCRGCGGRRMVEIDGSVELEGAPPSLSCTRWGPVVAIESNGSLGRILFNGGSA